MLKLHSTNSFSPTRLSFLIVFFMFLLFLPAVARADECVEQYWVPAYHQQGSGADDHGIQIFQYGCDDSSDISCIPTCLGADPEEYERGGSCVDKCGTSLTTAIECPHCYMGTAGGTDRYYCCVVDNTTDVPPEYWPVFLQTDGTTHTVINTTFVAGITDVPGESRTGKCCCYNPDTPSENCRVIREGTCSPGMTEITVPEEVEKKCYAVGAPAILQVPIPLKEGGFLREVKHLGQYFKAIFEWLVGALGVLAVVMIMVAGLQWIFAAGNTTKIGKAKERIGNAIFGLILAAGAVTILQIVNPATLSLKLTHPPEKIERVLQETIEGEFANDVVPASWTRNSNGVPHLRQCDSRWACTSYAGDCGETKCKTTDGKNVNNVCASGCGITSTAMILQKYGETTNPGEVAEWLEKQGYRSNSSSPEGATCNGVSHQAILSAASHFGLAGEEVDLNKAKELLGEEKPIIAHVREKNGACKFTNHGHYIVLTDFSSGVFSVNDPGSGNSNRFSATENELTSDCEVVGYIYLHP